jgi:hypothetical protein
MIGMEGMTFFVAAKMSLLIKLIKMPSQKIQLNHHANEVIHRYRNGETFDPILIITIEFHRHVNCKINCPYPRRRYGVSL